MQHSQSFLIKKYAGSKCKKPPIKNGRVVNDSPKNKAEKVKVDRLAVVFYY